MLLINAQKLVQTNGHLEASGYLSNIGDISAFISSHLTFLLDIAPERCQVQNFFFILETHFQLLTVFCQKIGSDTFNNSTSVRNCVFGSTVLFIQFELLRTTWSSVCSFCCRNTRCLARYQRSTGHCPTENTVWAKFNGVNFIFINPTNQPVKSCPKRHLNPFGPALINLLSQ